MAVNKVEINGKTIIDLTKDTVLPQTLLSGVTAHNAAGEPIVGAVAVAPASATLPKAPGEAAVGEENTFARGDHVHPKEVSDADRAAWNGKTSLVISEIPKGRMKGDINGDGEVSFDDLRLSSMYVSGSVTLDELQIWCGDVNNDGAIKSFDNTHLRRLIEGDPARPSNFTKTPTMADYYGNWTYVKVDDMTGYFYTDIAVEGLTATSAAIVAVQGDHKRDAFAGAECMDGVVRIKANLLPVAGAVCLVFYGSGDGTAVVVPENVVDRVGTAMNMRLASSTANSTKIFNITVDDSGVITATEVTT